jgi:hypothetical protein
MDLRSTLRLAQLEDLDALLALDVIARRDPQRRRFITQAIACGQCWVAADAHDAALLTGYGVLNDAFFEYPFIALVVVKESARGRGIAGAIATISGIENNTIAEVGIRKVAAILEGLGYELTAKPKRRRMTLDELKSASVHDHGR